MKSWMEWLIGIIAIVGAVGLLIALMLYNPADSPRQQEHMIVTPTVTAPPQVKASVVTPEAKPVEMPPEPQRATENDLTVEDEEIYAEEETTAEGEYQDAQEFVRVEVDETQLANQDWGLDDSTRHGLSTDGDETTDIEGDYGVYLGTWTVTFYCDCAICAGQWSGSPTASGTWPTAWHTVACGSLPFGTEIYIEGLGNFVVEDRGVDGEWVDIYLDNHDMCNEYGLQYRDVYIIGE